MNINKRTDGKHKQKNEKQTTGTERCKRRGERHPRLMSALAVLRGFFGGASGQVVERKRGLKFYWYKLMTFSLPEAFTVSFESGLRLISCLLRDGMIYRLFGHGGEIWTINDVVWCVVLDGDD
jgi:hypothetical protein